MNPWGVYMLIMLLLAVSLFSVFQCGSGGQCEYDVYQGGQKIAERRFTCNSTSEQFVSGSVYYKRRAAQ